MQIRSIDENSVCPSVCCLWRNKIQFKRSKTIGSCQFAWQSILCTSSGVQHGMLADFHLQYWCCIIRRPVLFRLEQSSVGRLAASRTILLHSLLLSLVRSKRFNIHFSSVSDVTARFFLVRDRVLLHLIGLYTVYCTTYFRAPISSIVSGS